MNERHFFEHVHDLIYDRLFISLDAEGLHAIRRWLDDIVDVTGKRDMRVLLAYLRARPVTHPVWVDLLTTIGHARQLRS